MESAKDPQQPPDRDQAGNGHLAEVNRDMVKGAAWTVAMRFSMRGIGLVSTVILARLLVPADFGLVALATIFFGLIEVMSQFGLGVFLIQKQNAGHDYYDTAWTLSILRGAVTCGLLFVIAMPFADFFGDPRLVEIFYVLALVALVGGIRNIGVISNYRRRISTKYRFTSEIPFWNRPQFILSRQIEKHKGLQVGLSLYNIQSRFDRVVEMGYCMSVGRS